MDRSKPDPSVSAHVALDAQDVSLHTELFKLHSRSDREVRNFERKLAGTKANLAMQPLQPRRARSSTVVRVHNKK